MNNDFRRFWRLSGREKTSFVLAYLLLPPTALTLRLFGYRSAWKILARSTLLRPTNPSAADTHEVAQAEEMSRLVAAAAQRSFFVPSCLTRSMVLCWLLRRRGIHGDLRIGVRLKGANKKKMEAHAWVEVGGCVLDPSGESSEFYAAAFGTPIPLDERDPQ